MTRFQALREDLETKGTGKMRVYGHSMEPLIFTGALLTYGVKEKYEVGDFVFCEIFHHIIDAHKIIQIDPEKGYLIANNHGFENGWTKKIFGYVTNIEY